MKRLGKVAVALAAFAMLLATLVWWLNLRGESPVDGAAPAAVGPQQVEHGAYLARAGNCMACHTERGGAAYAGGRAIDTPFGTLYASNLTPDARTGIGAWSASHFWRALHNGRSRDGRLLYPAFPYTHYTQVTRSDADALYAFLRSVPAATRENTPHALRWPYSTQAALAVWRALYFRPAHAPSVSDAPTVSSAPAVSGQSPEWVRGAYLVQGLGHCSACHAARNALGASSDLLDLSGGMIPMQNWYAPSLAAASEASVAGWEIEQITQLLKTGVSASGTVLGPMAEVVLHSTQHLSAADLRAMAVYLKAVPPAEAPAARPPGRPADAGIAGQGARLYEQHCVQCHGAQGQGVPGAYPPLAGNRAVNLGVTANLVQVVLNGGYPPATAGNPRPFGMPPYATVLRDADIAAVLTHIRTSWGNRAGLVNELDIAQARGGSLR